MKEFTLDKVKYLLNKFSGVDIDESLNHNLKVIINQYFKYNDNDNYIYEIIYNDGRKYYIEFLNDKDYMTYEGYNYVINTFRMFKVLEDEISCHQISYIDKYEFYKKIKGKYIEEYYSNMFNKLQTLNRKLYTSQLLKGYILKKENNYYKGLINASLLLSNNNITPEYSYNINDAEYIDFDNAFEISDIVDGEVFPILLEDDKNYMLNEINKKYMELYCLLTHDDMGIDKDKFDSYLGKWIRENFNEVLQVNLNKEIHEVTLSSEDIYNLEYILGDCISLNK